MLLGPDRSAGTLSTTYAWRRGDARFPGSQFALRRRGCLRHEMSTVSRATVTTTQQLAAWGRRVLMTLVLAVTASPRARRARRLRCARFDITNDRGGLEHEQHGCDRRRDRGLHGDDFEWHLQRRRMASQRRGWRKQRRRHDLGGGAVFVASRDAVVADGSGHRRFGRRRECVGIGVAEIDAAGQRTVGRRCPSDRDRRRGRRECADIPRHRLGFNEYCRDVGRSQRSHGRQRGPSERFPRPASTWPRRRHRRSRP